MGIGKEIEDRSHIVGFREEISKVSCDRDQFFTWFNSARDADAAFVRGSWDFAMHIAMPASRCLNNPEDKVALEIGYGGGRILASACRSFKHGIGVDIHQQGALVAEELERRGIGNYQLFSSADGSLVMPDCSVDVVYSFIVLAHVEKIEIFLKYLSETYRVLKNGGVAVLYYGRYSRFSHNSSSRIMYLLDLVAEPFVLASGYREIPARVNEYNLLISRGYAIRKARKNGFHVVDNFSSRRNVPDGTCRYGGQHGILLMKP